MHELKTNREAARLKSTKAEAEKEGKSTAIWSMDFQKLGGKFDSQSLTQHEWFPGRMIHEKAGRIAGVFVGEAFHRFPPLLSRRNYRIRICRNDFLSDSADKRLHFGIRNSDFGEGKSK